MKTLKSLTNWMNRTAITGSDSLALGPNQIKRIKTLLSLAAICTFASCLGIEQLNAAKIRYTFYRVSHNSRTVSGPWYNQTVRINKRTKYAFSHDEKQKIRKAMNIVASRLLRPDILNTALSNSKRFYVKGIKGNARSWKWRDFVRHTRIQFRGLRSRGIPRVRIVAWDHSRYSGQAKVGEYVLVRYVQATSLVPIYKITGGFHIELSKTAVRNSTADSIAGTIAHEMLHQMGHTHKDDGYADGNFITVFGDVLSQNGSFIPRGSSLSLRRMGRYVPR